MILQIEEKFELTRNIDRQDKFFVVKVKIGEQGFGKVGWIEKEFIEKDFTKNFPYKNFGKIEVIDYIEFTERKKYEQYKIDNDLP